MITFNIWGNCMSRQTASILQEKQFGQVLQNVGAGTSHPISAFSDKGERLISIDDLTEYTSRNFIKRCFCQDINKTALDYLVAKKSDYLIVDWIAARYGLFKKKGHYVVRAAMYWYNKEKIESDFGFNEYELVSPWDIDIEVWNEYIGKFCDFISKYYTPKQIILNECFGSTQYIQPDSQIPLKDFSQSQISSVNKYNELVKKIHAIFLEKIPNCHVINFPDGAIADKYNPFELEPFHYGNSYYEYAAKSIEVICSEYEDNKEREILNDLRKIYCEQFKAIKEQAVTQNKLFGTNNALNHTKKMLFDIFGEDKFINWLQEQKNNETKISVFVSGYALGQIFLKALSKFNIKPLLASPKTNFLELTDDEIEAYKKSDIVVCCGASAFKYDGITTISIGDLLDGKKIEKKE